MEIQITTNWRELLDEAESGNALAVSEMFNGDFSAVACLLKGYAVYTSQPDIARDLFSVAKRSSDVELSHEAAVFEARCYEYLGQPDEGKILIRALLRHGLSPTVRAHALFVFSVLQVSTPRRALKTLNRIDLETITPSRRARALYWRAKIQADLGKFDLALIDYAGAVASFEETGNKTGIAHSFNNLASVQRKLKRFVDAHDSVNHALRLLPDTDPFVANFLDQKAQILIAEKRFIEAERVARKAVAIVAGSDRLGVLGENLCTLARSLAGQKKFAEASSTFMAAQEIAERLDSPALLFAVTTARKESALEFLRSADVELAELALRISDGSYRSAAKMLGLTHPVIMKLLKQSDSKWKPKKPQSLICKSLN